MGRPLELHPVAIVSDPVSSVGLRLPRPGVSGVTSLRLSGEASDSQGLSPSSAPRKQRGVWLGASGTDCVDKGLVDTDA